MGGNCLPKTASDMTQTSSAVSFHELNIPGSVKIIVKYFLLISKFESQFQDHSVCVVCAISANGHALAKSRRRHSHWQIQSKPSAAGEIRVYRGAAGALSATALALER